MKYPYFNIFSYQEPQHPHSVLPNNRFYLFYFEFLPVSRGGYTLASYESLTAEEIGQEMGGN